MVNERDSKKSLGKIVGISLVIGVGMGIFLKNLWIKCRRLGVFICLL